MQVVEIFRGKIIDVTRRSLIVVTNLYNLTGLNGGGASSGAAVVVITAVVVWVAAVMWSARAHRAERRSVADTVVT
jgi:hypothetical protein